MRYKIKKSIDLIISAIGVVYFRMLYGKKSFSPPLIGIGKGLDVNIRKGGSFKAGKIKTRNGLSIFCDGGAIKIGDGCFFNNNCSLNSMSGINIGENSIFGENVRIYDHNHLINDSFEPQKMAFSTDPIEIGDNCWIGSNVVILKGVKITNNVTVGAGATIRKSITTPGIYAQHPSELKRIK